MLVEPARRARVEAEGHDHRVRRDGLLRSRNHLGHASPARTWRTQTRLHQLHAFHAIRAYNLDGLAVEQKSDALLLAVLVVAPRARHVGFVAPVRAGDAQRALADGSPIAIHAGIAAAQDDDVLVAHVDEPRACVRKSKLTIDVRHEIRQRLVHARQILARESALDVRVSAHPQEHRVEFPHEIIERKIAADLHPQAKLDPHPLHDLAALLDDVLFELERRNTEGEESPDLRVTVEHHRCDAVAHQDIGAAESGGPRTDDGDALVGAYDARQVRLPALLERLVSDVLFDRADAHRAEAVIQGAGAFAQPVLRADPAADFGQGIGLMRQFRRLEQLAGIDQREPVRNVVVNRTFPFAERITAGETASGLLGGGLAVVLRIDLTKMQRARLDVELVGIATRDIQKLQVVVGHDEALRGPSGRASQIDEQRGDGGRFRFHHPEFSDVSAEVVEQLLAPHAPRRFDVLLDEPAQMLHVSAHALRRDAVNVDQLVVVAIHEIALEVEHVGESAREAGAKIDARATEHAHDAAGHVLAAMISRALDHGERTGIAHGEALARRARGVQLAAGRPVQAGVPHDHRLARAERGGRGGLQYDLAARHALAHVVIRLAFEIQMQAARVPHAEALARGALERNDQRRRGHAVVAPVLRDLSRHARADGTMKIADGISELTAEPAVNA